MALWNLLLKLLASELTPLHHFHACYAVSMHWNNFWKVFTSNTNSLFTSQKVQISVCHKNKEVSVLPMPTVNPSRLIYSKPVMRIREQERERESSNLFVRHIKNRTQDIQVERTQFNFKFNKSTISLYNCRDGRLRSDHERSSSQAATPDIIRSLDNNEIKIHGVLQS